MIAWLLGKIFGEEFENLPRALAVLTILYLVALGGLIYVAVHFIAKFW